MDRLAAAIIGLAVALALSAQRPASAASAQGAPGLSGLWPSGALDAGPSTRWVDLVDVDLDGTLDCVSSGRDEVLVFRGRGDGSFDVPSRTTMPNATLAVELDDYDGDGLHDVAAVRGGAGYPYEVHLFPGNGDGTFQPALITATADDVRLDRPRSADFDADGRLDLIVGTLDSIAVHLGNGDGTFAAPLELAGATTGVIGVGDVDGDGAVDVVGTVPDAVGGGLSIHVHRGDGMGGFSSTSTIAASGSTQDLQVRDIDADGALDFAYCTAGNPTRIYWGLGDGTSVDQTALSVGPDQGDLALQDVDGDGLLDLVVPSRDSDSLHVFLNLGARSFATPRTYRVGADPRFVACADLDGDGRPDAVSVGRSARVSVTFGKAGGAFRAPRIVPAGATPVEHVLPGDFDGDGHLDACVLFNTGSGGMFDVEVLLGDGAGVFAVISALPIALPTGGNDINECMAADLDGDGYDDLVCLPDPAGFGVPGPVLEFHRSLGDGTFAPVVRTNLVDLDHRNSVLADLDGDGDLDFTYTAFGEPLRVLEGLGNGSFGAETSTALAGNAHSTMLAGDWTGDGVLDLALRRRLPADGVLVFPGNGDRTFGTPVLTAHSTVQALHQAIDWDRDGLLDLLYLESDQPWTAPRELTFARGLGDGSFEAAVFLLDVLSHETVVAADVDEDGLTDLLHAPKPEVGSGDPEDGSLDYLRAATTTTFYERAHYALGDDPALQGGAVALDFDEDGLRDIVAIAGEDHDAVFLLSSDGLVSPTVHGIAAPNSQTSGAHLAWSGSRSIAANDFTLTVTDCPPGQFGLFFYGPERDSTPFGNNGYLNVGLGDTGLFRVPPRLLTDGAGGATKTFDFGSHPMNAGPGAIEAGSTWNFQFWYRDPGTGFNFSDAIEVTFCP